MKPRYHLFLPDRLTVFLVAVLPLLFTACVEDDGFNNFRPVDFFISADRLNVDAGDAITYRDSSATGVSREWTFEGGDPATSTEANPSVTYNTPGTFLTFVTTTFADGSEQTRRLQLTVHPLVVADFAAVNTQNIVGVPVQFNNLTQGVGMIPATRPPGDSSILYKWVFEGISEDTIYGNNPAVTYNETGTFDVSLTVTRTVTGYTSTEVKEDYIQIVETPILAPASIALSRNGDALFLRMTEPLGDVNAGQLDNFSLIGSGGESVAFTSIGIPQWSVGNHHLELGIDPSSLTSGAEYTFTFNGQDVTFASESILGTISQSLTYFGGDPAWAGILYDNNGNVDKIVDLSGKMFQWVTTGSRFSWNSNSNLNIFNPGLPGFFASGWYAGEADTYTVTVTPQADATLDDIRAAGVEMFFLGPNGTTYQFNAPITDVRYHANDELSAELSADGRSLTLTNSPVRNGVVRVSFILENPADIATWEMTHDAPQETNIYVTAAGR